MKVSVIITALNAQDTIARALGSLLQQTLTDIEVIVVDDASSDRTADVVRGVMATDARVALLQNRVNLRVSASRNRGLDAARGDWIAVLDADDAFAPSRLAHLVEEAETQACDMMGDNLTLIDTATGACIGPAFEAADFEHCHRVTPEFMMEHDGPQTPRLNFGFMKPLISRAFLDRHGLRYQTDVWCAEDFLLYFDCLLAGARFGLTSRAHYRLHTNNGASLSRRRSVDREVSRVNRMMVERARAHGRSDLIPILLDRQRLLDDFAYVNALRYGRYVEALRCAPAVPAQWALREAYRRLRSARREFLAARAAGAR